MQRSRREFLKCAAGSVALTGPLSLIAGDALAGPQANRPVGTPEEAVRAFFAAAASGDARCVLQLIAKHPALLASCDDARRSAYAVALLNRHRATADAIREAGYESDLHEAALALDWERFTQLTDAAGDAVVESVNANHPIGGSAMVAAALGGAGSDIWRVYAACGDPNAGTADSPTALQAALAFADLATAEMTAASLLANAADPNGRGGDASSPLHLAAERGSFELVEMLIRLGAKVHATDKSGKRAFDVARSHGHEKVARLLHDEKQVARSQRTYANAVDQKGRPYRGADISDIPLTKRRAFVGQSHGNYESVANSLREEPRLVHSVATTNEICVEACAHTGRTNIVDLLLEHGAVYSLPTAVVRGDMATVKKMLDADASRIHARGAHDFALLWYPVIGGCDSSLLKLLLKRGAKIEAQHFLGTTALHWACLRSPLEIVELLIAHGADVNRVGRKFGADGQSPLELAERNDRKDVAALLRKHGARDRDS